MTSNPQNPTITHHGMIAFDFDSGTYQAESGSNNWDVSPISAFGATAFGNPPPVGVGQVLIRFNPPLENNHYTVLVTPNRTPDAPMLSCNYGDVTESGFSVIIFNPAAVLSYQTVRNGGFSFVVIQNSESNMKMQKAEKNIHGFNLLGKQNLVLSHIPMFMPPHQYQAFLEVTLEGKRGIDPRTIYLKDQKKSHSTDYVLVSDPIVLPDLAPDAGSPLRSFTGQLYRGWPWDKNGNLNPEQRLVPSLTIHVIRPIFFHSILNPSPLAELTYIAFHTDETVYLAHELRQTPESKNVKPPDFYQILSAKFEFEATSGEVSRVRFPRKANTLKNKLSPNSLVNGLTDGNSKVRIRTDAELIFDPNHLVM